MLTWLYDKDEHWHNIGANKVLNIGTASMHMKCWRDFMASWMLAWLRCKWSFDVAQCKYCCNFNANASANVECCRGFMTKMNVGTASMQMKCCCGFMTKMNVGTTSIWMKCRCDLNANRMSRQLYGKRRVLVQLHYKGKWWCAFIADANANIASWQSWMLARLQYKDKC